MKTVHTNDMVVHLWANQSQSEARNGNGSLFFRDSTIFSYGSHFPIARHVNGKVLFTTRKHSITTSRHCSLVRHAARHLDVIECDTPTATSPTEHRNNLKEMRERCYTYLERAARARSYSAWYLEAAEQLVKHHTAYRALFGLDLDEPLVIEEAWKKEAEGRIAAQVALARERSKQQKIQAEKRLEQKRKDLEEWKVNPDYLYGGFQGLPVALRARYGEHVTGQTLPLIIETSHGAQVPAEHARRLWNKVKAVKSSGVPYQQNGHTEHVGHFTVQSIDTDGTVVAGCHTITFEAMEELAGKLGW